MIVYARRWLFISLWAAVRSTNKRQPSLRGWLFFLLIVRKFFSLCLWAQLEGTGWLRLRRGLFTVSLYYVSVRESLTFLSSHGWCLARHILLRRVTHCELITHSCMVVCLPTISVYLSQLNILSHLTYTGTLAKGLGCFFFLDHWSITSCSLTQGCYCILGVWLNSQSGA